MKSGRVSKSTEKELNALSATRPAQPDGVETDEGTTLLKMADVAADRVCEGLGAGALLKRGSYSQGGRGLGRLKLDEGAEEGERRAGREGAFSWVPDRTRVVLVVRMLIEIRGRTLRGEGGEEKGQTVGQSSAEVSRVQLLVDLLVPVREDAKDDLFQLQKGDESNLGRMGREYKK